MNLDLNDPKVRTKAFARVMGPFLAVISGIALARPPRAGAFVGLSDFGVWPWATGGSLLMLGIVVVAFHQHWNSPAAFIISALGWLLGLRGFFLLAFPAAFTSVASVVEGHGGRALYAVLGLAGLYLAWVGWRPEKPRRRRRQRRGEA